MTLERGFRRIVCVVSVAMLGSGVLFMAVLGAAWAWSLHLDRQRETELVATGCPSENERQSAISTADPRKPKWQHPEGWESIPDPRKPKSVAVRIGHSRWRVMIPKDGFTSAYVVSAGRELTEVEVLTAISAPLSDLDRQSTDIARRHPTRGVEVVECSWLDRDIRNAGNDAPPNRLIGWWMRQPVSLVALVPVVLMLPEKWTAPRWLDLPYLLLPALLLTAVTAGLPWGLFYFARWIVRGFVGEGDGVS